MSGQSRRALGLDFARSTREQIIYFFALLIFVFISVLVGNRYITEDSDPAIQAAEGWVSETGDSVSLDDIPLGSHMLSKNVKDLIYKDKALCFRSIDTDFSVYADDELIYDYHPNIPPRFGMSYGMYVHTIAIPEETVNISIRVDPLFPSEPAGLDHVLIDDAGGYMLGFFKKNLFSFGLSMITLLLGFFFLAVGLSSAIMMRSAGIDFISFGITCMLIGFVGFNDTLLLQLLTGRPDLIRVVTYVCLMFLPFPALSFFAGATGNGRSKLVSGMMVLCLADFALQVLLTHKGYTDYFYLVNISHIIIGISIALALWFVVRTIREGVIRSDLVKSISVGLSACALGVVADLVRFHFFQSRGSANYTRFGVLIFAGVIGFFLFQDQTRALKQKHMESMALVGEITEAFAKVIDMKDSYTNGHSARVAKYTAMLANELGYDEETVEKYYRIALLHDIGKIGVPKTVLNKPGKLTDEEYSIIKSHTTMGYEALKDISIMPELATGAQAHHERPDGKGYPNGLSGSDIPRVAQIIAVADCFDAMYSDRPYRKRMNFDKAVSIIQEVSGTQLTPDVVKAFMELVKRGELKASEEESEQSETD